MLCPCQLVWLLLLPQLLLRISADSAASAASRCRRPDVKTLKCGWATEAELLATAHTCETCNPKDEWCGNKWGGRIGADLPWLMDHFKGYKCVMYPAQWPEFVSLACRPGKLVVRAVWKLLEFPDNMEIGEILKPHTRSSDSNIGVLRRCALHGVGQQSHVPFQGWARVRGRNDNFFLNGTTQREIDAALKAPELTCVNPVFGIGGKDKNWPAWQWYQVGAWYSDTFTFDFGGCDAVLSNEGKPDAE